MSLRSLRLLLGSALVCALFAPVAAARPDAVFPVAAGECASALRAPASVQRAGALETYDDFIEDTRGPDICGENVVTNDNEGTITVGLHIHNRRSWAAHESYGMFLATDSDPATGPDGADYVVRIAPGAIELAKWNGSACVAQGALPPAEWAPGYGPVFQLKAADLGDVKSFGFVFYSTDGTNVDYAPNRDAWPWSRDISSGCATAACACRSCPVPPSRSSSPTTGCWRSSRIPLPPAPLKALRCGIWTTA